MAIVVYHHPFSRAASVVWMLEELGLDYELKFVDIMKGEQKSPEILKLNPMGKLPIITDGDAVVSELAAIGIYLADRYSLGRLAPALDDPARATYLRWSFFGPSVMEPGLMAKSSGWTYKPTAAGWGDYETMIRAMEAVLSKGDYLLGDKFSMADAIFGGTLRYMLMFKMLEEKPLFNAYSERLGARPAAQKADARNAEIRREHGL